ncbi:MAG: ferrous iron transport protein A [Ruminococcus sp.]|nr:ferrous iron transport protein A [Ruminococcus sp.]MCD7800111.1 ferrous iron transport protein A [Ruminococcus sp.]
MILSKSEINERYCVTDISLDSNIKYRLQALGLTFGSTLRVLNKKFNGSIIIRIRGTRFAMGKSIADGISVEKIASKGAKK